MGKKLTKEDFIEKSKVIHNNKYDYTKVEYINNSTKVCIICPEHGEFWQTPANHLHGNGCPKCGKNKRNDLTRYTVDRFLTKARDIHGNKYDYSKIEKIKNHYDLITIICPEHGEFHQVLKNHLKGCECPYCGKNRNNKKSFILKARKVHGDKYDYSKVEYINNETKVCIICPEHGEFLQTPANHLHGNGCPKCGTKSRYLKTVKKPEDFIKSSIEIHDNKYDYSKVNYINGKTKVCIICPEHGEFWQLPNNHLRGSGCPKCKTSKLELEVMKFLKEKSIKYVYDKAFSWSENLRLDFYLPDYNVAIECQGRQHYEPVDFSGRGEEWANNELKLIQQRDEKKLKLCSLHGTNLIYINNKNEINESKILLKHE